MHLHIFEKITRIQLGLSVDSKALVAKIVAKYSPNQLISPTSSIDENVNTDGVQCNFASLTGRSC